jgi:AraC family carnitine catabolism transcriptional activator
MTDAPRRIGFLLLPQFSMMAFASALEPLRVANRLSRREVYRWTIFSADGLPVPASNQLGPHRGRGRPPRWRAAPTTCRC